MGGLSSASSADVVKEWLWGKMREAKIDGAVDTYHKGLDSNFNGMLFVKFTSSENCEKAMQAFSC